MWVSKQKIRESFSKVKEDIKDLKNLIKKLEDQIKDQQKKTEDKRELEELSSEVQDQKEHIIYQKNDKKLDDSTIRQTVRRLDASKNKDKNDELSLYIIKEASSTGNEGVRRLDAFLDASLDTRQTIRQTVRRLDRQSDAEIPSQGFEIINKNIDSLFFKLSKQELKIFLTVYQLEDEGVLVTTKALSLKMQLSESCIRDHLSSLFKKNAPLTKIRVNNRTNLLSINRDFKALNIKNRLIELYYRSDPNQHTLFRY